MSLNWDLSFFSWLDWGYGFWKVDHKRSCHFTATSFWGHMLLTCLAPIEGDLDHLAEIVSVGSSAVQLTFPPPFHSALLRRSY